MVAGEDGLRYFAYAGTKCQANAPAMALAMNGAAHVMAMLTRSAQMLGPSGVGHMPGAHCCAALKPSINPG